MTTLPISRRSLLQTAGFLVVGFSQMGTLAAAATEKIVREGRRTLAPDAVDSWLAVGRDGAVTIYTGKIDVGTGIQTAYAQIVADELDVAVDRITVVMGDTSLTPDQGKSTSSRGIVMGAQPLRIAACEARVALLGLAAKHLGAPVETLEARDGIVCVTATPQRRVSYGELIGDRAFSIELEVKEETQYGPVLEPGSPLKPARDYRVVGTSVPRFDVPAKVTGSFEYVHNVRLPGMLHGRVVRPPAFGATLIAVDEGSIASIPHAQLVRRGNFLGVVAAREEDAIRAAKTLRVTWKSEATLPAQADLYDALRKARVVRDEPTFAKGDVPQALAAAATRLEADYHFPYQLHGMIGPSCAVADVRADRATIWSGSQWVQGDRDDIATLLGLPQDQVRVVWRAASGSYGRLGCDDAAADAALMSQAVGQPVRVQWMRHDEHGWEPVSAAMSMNLRGGLDAAGRIVALDFTQWSASHSTGERRNQVAWRLMGTNPGWNRFSGQLPEIWYDVPAKHGRSIYVEPWLRSIYLRAPGVQQAVFAFESFIDELAATAEVDPVEFRLRHIDDPRVHEVLATAARVAGWQPGVAHKRNKAGSRNLSGAVLSGRGVAVARYGDGPPRIALVAHVEVERATGMVRVTRVAVALDCGLVVNPNALTNQIQGGVLQGLSRSLKEEMQFDREKVTSLDWVDYPILRFSEMPEIEVALVNRPDQPPTAAGEVSTIPTSAAVANAIYDATGVRLRRVPFTPATVKASL
jgi:CO/xanthine dehydrogenase Mo-binding subunit